MFCKKCGNEINEIRDGVKFCSKCGAPISFSGNGSPSRSNGTGQQALNRAALEAGAFEQYLRLKKKINTTSEFKEECGDLDLETGFSVVPALFLFFMFYHWKLGFLGMIIGAVIGAVAGNILYKIFLSIIPDEYTKKGRENIRKKLDTFEANTLHPIELKAVTDGEKRLHLSKTGQRFTIGEREHILTFKNGSIRSLNQYREEVEKVCLLKLIRCKIKALDVLKNKLANLYHRNKNRYSTELCQALESIMANEVIKQCQTNVNESNVELLLTFEREMMEVQEKCNAEDNSIMNENVELEKAYHALEKTFHELQAKLVPKSFYSDTFRKALKTCNGYFEIPMLDRDLSVQEYDDLLKNMDSKIKELQSLYQTECEVAKKQWEHNAAIAADLLRKMEAVCGNGNDVVYSCNVTSMERQLFSQIKNNKLKLDAKTIEKKIKELERRRKSERDSIMKTIRDYEVKIQRAWELVKVYERTSDRQVLYKGFLKRRKAKG